MTAMELNLSLNLFVWIVNYLFDWISKVILASLIKTIGSSFL